MTSSLIRSRPRRAKAHIRVRVAHAVLGALVGAGWLVLPVMTAGEHDPVPVVPAGPVASAAAPEQDGTSVTDLLMPLVAVGAAGALAGYGYLRRTRRARTRTTPGVVSAAPPVPTPVETERQARAALVLADDCVRGSGEELSFVEELFGREAVEPFTHALRAAETELSAAFAIWRRYEEGVPGDASARRQALVGVVGRCAEAGRRLDGEAEELDRLRGLEQGVGAALEVAEARFRELAARTATAQATAAELHQRYAPSAGSPVTGYVEQAKDRLVFATAQLNESRQAADTGDRRRAARKLRAAEGGVAQAGVLVGGVERLAADLREAAELVPAALTGAEAKIAEARRDGARALLAPGELHARIAHADGVLAAVRAELTTGPYDPLDALRRIARAVERLEVGRSGVVEAAARLVSRSAVGGAEDFVSVHRGAVGAEARARLAEAERALGSDTDPDVPAREARDLAERDVRAHGNPYADGHATGLAGAVLGGILLAEDPDGGPPTSFGGPETRGRRHLP
ncbi:hypothetical protein [Streptomyces diastatochromogenes]|uniref:TPM domain-containing protein n=1 Tax=Streptomyces diastatochromogenes TaxID=42236 RepID=A0A233SRG4_STRDA|nr:hypothetical protein [Streptomyces diastatochromogenes]OXY98199.1 hypothetical protein BEK98_04805 [Streptomyces diastatochromogenes]